MISKTVKARSFHTCSEASRSSNREVWQGVAWTTRACFGLPRGASESLPCSLSLSLISHPDEGHFKKGRAASHWERRITGTLTKRTMELKIDLSETHVFVWPRSPDEVNGPPPEDDAILFCFISLSIPPNVTPNQLSSLSLSLRATENIGVGASSGACCC